MNSKKARQLRLKAKQEATEPYGTTNANIDMKTMKSGRMVMDDKGAMAEELVPVVTYTTVMNDGCSKKIYKKLKREETLNA